MFELEEHHRKHLVNELTDAISKQQQLDTFINAEKTKIEHSDDENPRDPFMMASIEIDQYLNNQRIALIENALIQNEIDY
jgi:hypothetical protein